MLQEEEVFIYPPHVIFPVSVQPLLEVLLSHILLTYNLVLIDGHKIHLLCALIRLKPHCREITESG